MKSHFDAETQSVVIYEYILNINAKAGMFYWPNIEPLLKEKLDNSGLTEEQIAAIMLFLKISNEGE